MESAEAFRLFKEYLLKIMPDLWHELSCREASGITPVLPARGKLLHSRDSVEIKRQESGTKSSYRDPDSDGLGTQADGASS